jgi:molecular chaperone GrpE
MTKKNDPSTAENDDLVSPGEQDAAARDAEAGAAPEQADSQASLEDQLAAAREESRQNHERYLRTVADWENYRRRMTREKEELRQFAIGNLLEDFLPVLDNLSLGLQSAANHPEAANVTAGFQMVADQIRTLLERNGLEEVNPAGEAFDPHKHESLTHQPHDEIPEGHVVQVIRKGYTLNGRLLRPAAVLVSSGPAQS